MCVGDKDVIGKAFSNWVVQEKFPRRGVWVQPDEYLLTVVEAQGEHHQQAQKGHDKGKYDFHSFQAKLFSALSLSQEQRRVSTVQAHVVQVPHDRLVLPDKPVAYSDVLMARARKWEKGYTQYPIEGTVKIASGFKSYLLKECFSEIFV